MHQTAAVLYVSKSPDAFAQSTSMARSKSSSSGLRLAFYPERILWEWELRSRLCDHIKQWLFVVNKARAACRGPSLSLSFSHSLFSLSRPSLVCQPQFCNSGLSDKCTPVHHRSLDSICICTLKP